MTQPNTPERSSARPRPAPPQAWQDARQHQPSPSGQLVRRPLAPDAPVPYQQQAGHQPEQAGVAPQPAGYQLPQAPLIRKQGAWGLWWLVLITCGIYYYVWYARINRELAVVLRHDVPADGQWWCQLVPVYNLVGLARTAKRVNVAHAAVGSPTRVGVFVTWFWATWWFASQTRYLQRRINILHDILASHSVR